MADTSKISADHPVQKLKRKFVPPVNNPEVYLGGTEQSPEQDRQDAAEQSGKDRQVRDNPFQYQPQVLARRTKAI